MSYIFKNNKIRLFELALVAATIIISISLVRNATYFSAGAFSQSTTQTTLKNGWNLITIPYSGFSAKGLCQQYSLSEVAKMAGDTWERYNCADNDSSSFPIEPHKGYFVRQENEDYTIFFTGRPTKNKLDIKPGWNAYFATNNQYSTASNFCQSSPFPGFRVTEAARWAFGAWIQYNCDSPLNDFAIIENTTYFLRLVSLTSDGTEGTIPQLTTPE